ncbi:MAG TPA: flagellar basal body rod protein FlgC [Planctomycetes bacterium]|nr:flagellar basal body rod protein FlgC [Planctomycetota bacterium]
MAEGIFGGFDISISGMSAERTRMDIIASNIANANTIGPDGPYQRKQVTFREILDGEGVEGGVAVQSVAPDLKSEHPRVRIPGHPYADSEGFVRLPNVNIMFEMVDLASARRSFISNLQAFRAYRSMAKQAVSNMSSR